MLTYSFDSQVPGSMYEHLYRCIREDIVTGKLAAHEKLPSKRSFAKNLGVSNTTVENAYTQLVIEGYLYAKPKRGFFVSALDRQPKPPPPPPSRIAVTDRERGDYFADLTDSGVAADLFPFSVWLRLLRQVMAVEDEKTLLTDRPAGGMLQLREAIAEHLRAFRGMRVSPEQIIVGAGTEYLYSVLIQLLGRHRIYGVEDPGPLRLTRIYERNDVDCRHIPLDEGGVHPRALYESGAEVLHITPSHHFPTGLVMPVSRRYELLAWAAEGDGRYIIEDDYDCEFRLSGRPIPTFQSIDEGERVIYINNFSQSLAPAFRISYLVLPWHLVRRFYDTLGFDSGTVSCFEQLTLARFLFEGHFERHINRMRNHYRFLRDSFISEIRRGPLGEYVQITQEDSGVHFLMKVNTYQTDVDLLQAAQAEGLRLSAVSQYYHDTGTREEHVLVINYSGLPAEKLPETARRLCRCILPREKWEERSG
ncbi:MAG: GntR family transcriptional regulator [Firmicutes bacterium]|nr:GntR family transcriptional regulator [Bacillota bacterium]